MSGLIKAGAAQSVHRFLDPCAHRSGDKSAAGAQVEPREDARLTGFQREIEALREALSQSAVALERAKAEAKEAGRREALDAFQKDDARQLQALEGGVSAALQAWNHRLTELDGLAVMLSRAALSKIFDDLDTRSELVLQAIARQMRHLRRETVVAVRVSRRDFPNEAALEAAAAQISTGSLSLVADADLQAGDCRLDLQLGHIDIGPRAQWAQLAALLDELMAGESSA